MPAAAQEIDWPGLRAASAAIGIRPAARRAGADLPPEEAKRFEERVAKRATRERWESARAEVVHGKGQKDIAPVTPGRPTPKPLSMRVLSGAEAVQDVLADDEKETRLSLSRTARRLARESEAAPIVLETPADVLAVAKLYAVTHRIGSESGAAVPTITLNVGFLLDCQAPGSSEGEIRDVEAEVTRGEAGEAASE